MNDEQNTPEEVADRLRGKKVIKRADIAQSASEAAETVNQELNLEIENPDDFSELRDSVEKTVLKYLASKDNLFIV